MGLFGSDMNISLWLKLERELQQMEKNGLGYRSTRKKIRLSNNKKHRDFDKERTKKKMANKSKKINIGR